MYIEEQIIASGFMFIFAGAVWFTRDTKNLKFSTNPLSPWWEGWFVFFYNKDGTQKKYTKLILSLIFVLWGISFWLFPDIWSHRE